MSTSPCLPRPRTRVSHVMLAAMAIPLAIARVAHAVAAAAVSSTAATAAGDADAASKSVFGWWEVMLHGSRAELFALASPRWWVAYIAAEFDAEPAHVIVETACIVTIIYLMLLRKPAPMQQEKLSKKEEEELIAEWKPVPLCATPAVESNKTRFVVESATGRTIRANGTNYLNFASTNFLGLGDREDIKTACRETIEKYGVGSCGPRGFYGTFDVHLEVERVLAEYLGAEECILYSDAVASISSVIPAFAKKGDVIVVDDSCSFAIQQGCLLSRSNISYFKHNDLVDLERVLKGLAAKEKASGSSKILHRKFIVLEGVSAIDGSIAPMAAVVKLKDKFKFRLIMDDSLGFGTLGKTGRGTLEHFGLTVADVDAVCVAMDCSLAAVGGFCVGTHQVVDHQRLSGAGYCFSASSPPYTVTAAILALAEMDKQPSLGASLRKKAVSTRKALASAHKALVVLGSAESSESPVIHLALKRSVAGPSSRPPADEVEDMEALNESLIKDHAIVCSVPEFIPTDNSSRKATLRILLSTLHTEADLDKLVKAVAAAANKVL